MLFIDNKSRDAYFNLASEEYLMENFTEDIFMLWRNDRTIVVGKNQNTLAEINADYVKRHNINVVRRLSGGGAVYHDTGNINFTFILTAGNLFSDYETFTRPIVSFLKGLGVNAALSGRNDLVIDGKKISGNAQYMHGGRILHHGTLLFSACAADLEGALRVSGDKISSKGIKSVRSRVTNISSHLPSPMTVEEFISALGDYMIKNADSCTKYDLDAVRGGIERLKESKYSRWEWNYGYSPKYGFCKSSRFPCGGVEINLDVGTDGIIKNAVVRGDFFSEKPVSELEAALCGLKHRESDISGLMDRINISEYISGITSEQFLNSVF